MDRGAGTTTAPLGSCNATCPAKTGYTFTAPAAQTLTAGGTITFTCTYTQQTGTIRVYSNYQNAAFAVLGVTDFTGPTGTSPNYLWTKTGVPAGNYTINSTSPISVYSYTPSTKSGTLSGGGTLDFTITYNWLDANCIEVSGYAAPTSMTPGQTKEVRITCQNLGINTWTNAGGYKLGSQNPQDNTTWIAPNRIALSAKDSIGPTQSKTFIFTITAPSSLGTKSYGWRMVRDGTGSGYGWFGNTISKDIEVKVSPGTSSMDLAATVTRPGTSYTNVSDPTILKNALNVDYRQVANGYEISGSVRIGDKINLSSLLKANGNNVSGAAFTWKINGTAQTDTSSAFIFSPTAPGTYTIELTSINDPTLPKKVVKVVVPALGSLSPTAP